MQARRFALMLPLVAVAVSACNASALTKRELVVYFNSSATNAQREAVLQVCGNVSPDAVPEPFSTKGPVAQQVGDVRFRIDHADDRSIAHLETCLHHQPGVVGDQIPDLTN